jgi:hypothetical protein
MQASDLPTRFPVPFASSVIAPYIRAIPQVSSGVPGEASLEEGFPPENFDPVASGGIPPSGADFNGLLNQLSAWCRWFAAGGIVPWNSAYATAIGGYPSGAYVSSATTAGLAWLSIADNNVTNPDSNGAGWIPVSLVPQIVLVAGAGAFTTNVKTEHYGLTGSGARSTTLPSTNLFVGCRQVFSDLVGNFNTGNVTVAAPGGMTIAGLASVALNVNRQTAAFRYFGSNLWSFDT